MAQQRSAAPALLPAYLVVGGDQLKRETATKRLKARLDQAMAVFNLDERTASDNIDPTDIAISLNTLAVGDGFRLVLLHDANLLPKAVQETIISYLDNPTHNASFASMPKSSQRIRDSTKLSQRWASARS